MMDSGTMMKTETRVCKRCGTEYPVGKFQLIKPKNRKPYRIGTCNKCRYQDVKKRRNQLRQRANVITEHMYQVIPPQRILDINALGIQPIKEDEIFVRMIEYKDFWISNYGRAIKRNYGKYNLLKGKVDKWGHLSYSVKKEIYQNGKWTYYQTTVAADYAVMNEFVVNPDVKNNIKCYHLGGDKLDNYYKHLYPLNTFQYSAAKAHFDETGEDSEEFLYEVINDYFLKPLNWREYCFEQKFCGIGFKGSIESDFHSVAYQRWKDMMYRCYSGRYEDYEGCTVCEEWHNFSNFEIWYNSHLQGNVPVDLDKDILYKGNKMYSPETCCLVPHSVNTLFLRCNRSRGEYPIGVHYDKSKKKFRANVNIDGKQQKSKGFDTVEEAFQEYKNSKEKLIKEMAEKYKDVVMNCVYEAMMNWKVEIMD